MKMRLFFLLILFISFIPCWSQEMIEMKQEDSNVYTVPCEVNGLKLRFILDTGASNVCISLTEASFMLKNGYLDKSDILGTTNARMADGRIAENYIINLKQLKIGSVTLNDVSAVVTSGLDAPLLLGQSVLNQLGHWSIKNSTLILNEKRPRHTIQFSDYRSLEDFCYKEKANGNIETALNAIQNYCSESDDIQARILYTNIWENECSVNAFTKECLNFILQYEYNDPQSKFDTIYQVAWYCNNKLIDIERSTEIYEYLARSDEFPKFCKEVAFSDLFFMYYLNEPEKAHAYTIEALDNGIFKLVNLYCRLILIENERYTEAFDLLNKGHLDGYTPCSRLLAEGYINNWWTIKDKKKGINIFDTLAQNNDDEAINYLCYYYYDNGDYDNIIKYASKSSNEVTRNILQGIAFFHIKNYLNARNFLENTTIINGDFRIISERLSILGQIYEKGLAVKPNITKAFNYYDQLSEYNPAYGYGMLGDMFFLNELIETDSEQAYKYYLLGANNDSAYCCFRLALMNYYGVGTFKNEIKARDYKKKAIELGFKETDFDF